MKKAQRTSLVFRGIIVICFAALSAYVIRSQSIEELLLCADTGGLNIPFSKTLCKNFLFAFRGSQHDIDTLHQGIGASFVTQGASPASEREQVLRFLIGKGLDVNRSDMHHLTPLHGAVLSNSADEVEILLRNGADINRKDERFHLTPLELALKLQHEDRTARDRQAVIALLKKAQ